MSQSEWYTMTPQTAQAFGRPTTNGFLVRAGSTAMVDGSPHKKRDRPVRDKLVADGVLVKSVVPELYRFACDHEFSSSSAAGGVIRDGNCSGPGAWKRVSD
jgi:hypothetical protein